MLLVITFNRKKNDDEGYDGSESDVYVKHEVMMPDDQLRVCIKM